ncbi:protein kinase domain-containing protein [Anatilimnocola floriformis]|uniref:protein kinase domain-containing protein n=1 Tax=Anatilimnocola floriformis TaxID=2948575 RepID=UPI0020C237C2|nr:protein kinase [Anatilimnocola floriformis]
MTHNEPADNKLRVLVDEVMDAWRSGSKPDALAILKKYPQLHERHSLCVDLAYEEFCLREEAGETVDQKEFCDRFTTVHNSLFRMLTMHNVLHSISLGVPKPKSTNWPEAGTTWCGWKLLEELGRGGFSRVFLAEEPALGNRSVVVKCSTSGPGEAFLLGKLEHPHIMPIHSIQHDEQRGLVGICMPFHGRATLAEAIDQLQSTTAFQMPASDSLLAAKKKTKDKLAYSVAVAGVMEKLARGVAAAHEAKVLHGDIKPSNIILSFDDEPLLMDFNLSTDGEEGALRIGGTPPYMAPERLPKLAQADAATAGEQGYRSDIFSLGVVFAELLYGTIPFEFEVEDLLVRYEPATPRATQLNLAGFAVPALLKTIIDKAIALNPKDRFATAEEMADALAAFVHQYERRKTLIRLAWIVCIVGVLLTGWGIAAQMLKPSPQRLLLNEANRFLSQREYSRAEERFYKLHQMLPRHEWQAERGWCYAGMGKYETAKSFFLQAQPNSDPTGALWYNIGLCDLFRGAPHPAVDSLSRAIKLDPSYRPAYWHRAIGKLRRAQIDGAKLPPDIFDDIEFALDGQQISPYLYYDAANLYGFALEKSPDQSTKLRPRCEWCIRKALEAGVPPKQFANVRFQSFDIEALTPQPLPLSVEPSAKIEAFRPLPFNLQAALSAAH